jgi:hypothetical protein
MRDILTISFAHPSLKGFLMWGFWDGAHWLNNAPIYNQDWSLKPSGTAFIDQVFHQWWTNTSAQTPTSGEVTLRGFKGKYRMRVACSNSIQEQDIVLDEDKVVTVKMNCTTRTREATELPVLSVWPNFIQNQLSVSWETFGSLEALYVSNSLGQLVANVQKPTGQELVLNTTSWPNGVYFLKADFGGRMASKKLVLQR